MLILKKAIQPFQSFRASFIKLTVAAINQQHNLPRFIILCSIVIRQYSRHVSYIQKLFVCKNKKRMDMASLMTSLPIWLIFLIAFIIGMLAAQVGAWLSRQREQRGIKDKDGLGTLVGAMLGLLAFLLGFIFSTTYSRYGDRKALVIEQSQALTTCYLRTDFIPENKKQEARKILKETVDLLIAIKKPSEIDENLNKMQALNLRLWNVAASLSSDSLDSELRSLYVSSTNDIIDVFTERKTVALIFRINGTVWTVMWLLYFIGMMAVGAEAATTKSRRLLNVPIMCAAFALVVALISEIDSSSTRPGRFTANQQPLIDVQNLMSR